MLQAFARKVLATGQLFCQSGSYNLGQNQIYLCSGARWNVLRAADDEMRGFAFGIDRESTLAVSKPASDSLCSVAVSQQILDNYAVAML